MEWGRGTGAGRSMVQSMALHHDGCMGASQPKGFVARESLPTAAEDTERCTWPLLAQMLLSPCAKIPVPNQPALHLSFQPLLQETLWPVDCGGCCPNLALSEKEILIIYVQFV